METRRQEILRSWMKLSLFILFFIGVGFLFQSHHYMLGSVMIGVAIIILLLIEEAHMRDNIFSDIDWMNRALFDKKELDDLKSQCEFYQYVLTALKQGRIKKGMGTEEIYKLLDTQDEKISFRLRLYFKPIDEKLNDLITLYGFGLGIPTPKLILEIDNKSLKGWKEY